MTPRLRKKKKIQSVWVPGGMGRNKRRIYPTVKWGDALGEEGGEKRHQKRMRKQCLEPFLVLY